MGKVNFHNILQVLRNVFLPVVSFCRLNRLFKILFFCPLYPYHKCSKIEVCIMYFLSVNISIHFDPPGAMPALPLQLYHMLSRSGTFLVLRKNSASSSSSISGTPVLSLTTRQRLESSGCTRIYHTLLPSIVFLGTRNRGT